MISQVGEQGRTILGNLFELSAGSMILIYDDTGQSSHQIKEQTVSGKGSKLQTPASKNRRLDIKRIKYQEQLPNFTVVGHLTPLASTACSFEANNPNPSHPLNPVLPTNLSVHASVCLSALLFLQLSVLGPHDPNHKHPLPCSFQRLILSKSLLVPSPLLQNGVRIR